MYFENIEKIKYEGVDSKNPLAYKYYDANKENEEKLYFPTPKNFGRDQRIFNLYYNHEALT